MSEEYLDDALKFFKKIVKHELNIFIDTEHYHKSEETQDETTVRQPEVIETPPTEQIGTSFQAESAPQSETQSIIEEPQLQEPTEPIHGTEPTATPTPTSEETTTPPQPAETFKELSMEALSPDIIDLSHAFMNEIRSLRETLLERIKNLEERIEKIEKIIPELIKASKEKPLVKVSTPIAEHKFYTDETEIWLRDAQEILRSDEISLERLIKLEALEWNLLKARESGSLENDIANTILQNLRMEINRLRHMLLQ
ncbi:MAG: hypothetical protein Q6363_009935 [Candidatus Njordarchaeota archaeon]